LKALITDLIEVLPQERKDGLLHYQKRLDGTIAKSFDDVRDKREASEIVKDSVCRFEGVS
jgi:hypothetical protein